MEIDNYTIDPNPYNSVAEFTKGEKEAGSLKSVLDWFDFNHSLKISFENVGSSKHDNRYVYKLVDVCMRPHYTMIRETEFDYIQDALWDGIVAAERCIIRIVKPPTVGDILFRQTIDLIEKDFTKKDTI